MTVTVAKDGQLAYDMAQLQGDIAAASAISDVLTVDGDNLTSAGDVTVGNFLTMADGGELTISGGVVTATASLHNIDTEGDAASDNLDTINGAATGRILIIRSTSGARDIIVKDATGNLFLAGDCTLGVINDRLMIIGRDANWFEVSRSING